MWGGGSAPPCMWGGECSSQGRVWSSFALFVEPPSFGSMQICTYIRDRRNVEAFEAAADGHVLERVEELHERLVPLLVQELKWVLNLRVKSCDIRLTMTWYFAFSASSGVLPAFAAFPKPRGGFWNVCFSMIFAMTAGLSRLGRCGCSMAQTEMILNANGDRKRTEYTAKHDQLHNQSSRKTSKLYLQEIYCEKSVFLPKRKVFRMCFSVNQTRGPFSKAEDVLDRHVFCLTNTRNTSLDRIRVLFFKKLSCN